MCGGEGGRREREKERKIGGGGERGREERGEREREERGREGEREIAIHSSFT